MKPAWNSPQDFLKWLLFELGAGFYARKLATGAEAELRREFADFFLPASSGVGKRVLDVGCGPGHLAREMAKRGCEMTAVDRGTRLLRIAEKWAAREGVRVEFREAAAEALPFADNSFDATCATTVIYFVAEPARALGEMARVTRPGGLVATLDPHESMSVAAMREYCRREDLSKRDTRKLVQWSVAAQLNRRFTEKQLRELYDGAGIRECQMQRRLGGMVWMARGVAAKIELKRCVTI